MRPYWYVLVAAFCYGFTPVMTRFAVLRGVPPITGTVVAIGFAAVFLYATLKARGNFVPMRALSRRTQGLIVISGFCGSFGVLMYWAALEVERVSIIVPINSAFPLVTLLLSWVLLRQDERITGRLIIGAVFIIGGAVLITI